MVIGRILDLNHKPFPRDYQFSPGEKVVVAEDEFCCYSWSYIVLEPKLMVDEREVIFRYYNFIQDETWIVEDLNGTTT